MEGELRLVGGSNFTEGRLEICLNDEWGTVCDEQWNTTDASVVCRQLSLSFSGNNQRLEGYSFCCFNVECYQPMRDCEAYVAC